MDIAISNIVRSTAGRDKGDLFFVLATEETSSCWLTENGAGWRTPSESDGSIRSFTGRAYSPVAEKIRSGEKSPIVSFVKP